MKSMLVCLILVCGFMVGCAALDSAAPKVQAGANQFGAATTNPVIVAAASETPYGPLILAIGSALAAVLSAGAGAYIHARGTSSGSNIANTGTTTDPGTTTTTTTAALQPGAIPPAATGVSK